ncbi:glycoside hydrolase family 6 protein [Streptomyces alkaliphilus]|uniref:glycoside hydrolase family 6 protein n=1 Tax=Streptomyces alkaliphilus TaxID=1472722 RepID=UPI001181127A|nr:glycoside hydrolase family 6 protein [Streptomyces alkaliphilus]MQS07856.1 glycosyl hydrolase family 6 [Streptomyces alkaliphilus]
MSRTNPPPKRRFTQRTAILSATALLAAGVGAGGLMQGTASANALGCSVDYSTNDWGSGFTANISINNGGSAAINGWTLTYAYSGNQQLQQGWNAQWSQSGQNVTVSNLDWNRTIAAGSSVSFGGNFNYSGTNAAPTSFAVNGVTCSDDGSGPGGPGDNGGSEGGDGGPGDNGGSEGGDGGPGGPGGPGNGERVDNPYVGAGVYVNPEWSANAASEPGGSAIAHLPTGVWLDRIAAIEGAGQAGNRTMGLREHLDEAVVQAQDHDNFVFQVVIYNLPGRDCAALASNGELGPEELDRYKDEYIGPIADILSDPKYSDLRIVAVIEIDSLPNLVTNVGNSEGATEMCDRMLANRGYVRGVGHALATLGAIPNVYNYIDAAHHGWIGWDSNFVPSARIFHEAANAEGATPADVHGFITNTSNYSPTVEPYFKVTDTVNGVSVRQAEFVDWNDYVDEQSFAQALRQELVRQGFDSGIGMLIDTSRNGWGGPNRPTGPGPMTTVDAYVDGSRIEQRYNKGNWCNQAGAGLGERPTTAPAPGIDAYVWIKPPGESDGASREIPNDEGKGFDRMCDPTYQGNARNGFSPSGALPDAPVAGHWFSAQFQELLANAYPPVN